MEIKKGSENKFFTISDMEIKKGSDSIIFKFSDLEVIFDERYFIYSHNRHDYVLQEIERYFIDNGERGCFINGSCFPEIREYERNHYTYTKSSNIWVIDMYKVFKDIQLKENDIINEIKSIMNESTIRWYDGTN